MAGFLAGFGQGFSSSFEKAQARKADFENDIFKMTFNSYLEGDKERKKAEKADAANVSKAKSLAEVLPGVNKKAATAQIYKMLSSGLDEDFIMNELQKPGARIEFSQEVAQNKETLEAQTDAATAPGPSMDRQQNMNQIEQSQPSGQMQAQKPEPQKPSWRDNFAGGLFNSPYSRRDNAKDKAIGKISGALGVDQQRVQDTISGNIPTRPGIDTSGVVFTPGRAPEKDQLSTLNSAAIELAEAKHDLETNPSPAAQSRMEQAQRRIQAIQQAEVFKAQQKAASEGRLGGAQRARVISPEGTSKLTYVEQDANGNWVDINTQQPVNGRLAQITEEEDKRYQSLVEDVQKKSDEYTNKVVAFTSLARDAGDIKSLVDQTDGKVLSTRTGSLVQYLQGWAPDIALGMSFIDRQKNSNKILGSTPSETAQIMEVEKKIDGMLSQGVSDVGVARSLMEAKVKIMSYKLGAMNGQDGRALSENERMIFEAIASAGNSKDKFNQNMANLIFTAERDLINEGNVLNQFDQRVRNFESQFGWKPDINVALNVEEAVAQDPRTAQALEAFRPYDNVKIGKTGAAPRGGNTPVGRPTPQSQGQIATPDLPIVATPEEAKQLPPNVKGFKTPDGRTFRNPNYTGP